MKINKDSVLLIKTPNWLSNKMITVTNMLNKFTIKLVLREVLESMVYFGRIWVWIHSKD